MLCIFAYFACDLHFPGGLFHSSQEALPCSSDLHNPILFHSLPPSQPHRPSYSLSAGQGCSLSKTQRHSWGQLWKGVTQSSLRINPHANGSFTATRAFKETQGSPLVPSELSPKSSASSLAALHLIIRGPTSERLQEGKRLCRTSRASLEGNCAASKCPIHTQHSELGTPVPFPQLRNTEDSYSTVHLRQGIIHCLQPQVSPASCSQNQERQTLLEEVQSQPLA